MRKSNFFLFAVLVFAVAQLPAQSARADTTTAFLRQSIDNVETNIQSEFSQLENLNNPAVDEFLEGFDNFDVFANPDRTLGVIANHPEIQVIVGQMFGGQGSFENPLAHLQISLESLRALQRDLAAAEQEEFRRMIASQHAAHAALRGAQVSVCRSCNMMREHRRH